MQINYCVLESLGKELMTSYDIDSFDFAFVRNIILGLFSMGLTRYKGLSFRKDNLFWRHWKPLLANAVGGCVSMILCNYSWLFLPLTIWYVILCTLPFMLAVISYFVYGEKMGTVSIIAAILSFGAIIMLTMAKPASDDEEENWNYTVGVIICFTAVMAICVIVLTTR